MPRLPWPLIGLAVLLLALVVLALARRGPDSSVAQEAEPGQLDAEAIETPEPNQPNPSNQSDQSDRPEETGRQQSNGGMSEAFEKLLRPALDPKSVPDTLRVRFLDGRAPRKLATIKRTDGVYIDINDLVPLTGTGYAWDPEAYRGYIDVDSLGVNFSLDTPLFWAGSEVLQLSASVRYADEQLLIPYDFLDRILVPTLGGTREMESKERGTLAGGPATMDSHARDHPGR